MKISAVKMRITRLIKVIEKYNKNKNYILVCIYTHKLFQLTDKYSKELQ